MPAAIPPPGFDELTIEEQIDYVQSLWERIAATPDQVPVLTGTERCWPNASRTTTQTPTPARAGTSCGTGFATSCVNVSPPWRVGGSSDHSRSRTLIRLCRGTRVSGRPRTEIPRRSRQLFGRLRANPLQFPRVSTRRATCAAAHVSVRRLFPCNGRRSCRVLAVVFAAIPARGAPGLNILYRQTRHDD